MLACVCVCVCAPRRDQKWPELFELDYLIHFLLSSRTLKEIGLLRARALHIKGFGQFVVCLLSQVGTDVELILFCLTYPI